MSASQRPAGLASGRSSRCDTRTPARRPTKPGQVSGRSSSARRSTGRQCSVRWTRTLAPCRTSARAALGSREGLRSLGPARSSSRGSPAAARPRPSTADRAARRSASKEVRLAHEDGKPLHRMTAACVGSPSRSLGEHRRKRPQPSEATADPVTSVGSQRSTRRHAGRVGGASEGARAREEERAYRAREVVEDRLDPR